MNLFGETDKTIDIGGKLYDVDRDETSVWLRKHGSDEPYQISYSDSSRSLTGPVNAGLECDCPDFERRHAGTGSHGCKHITKLASLGLLPNPPAPIREPGDDKSESTAWAEAMSENRARADYLGLP